MPTSYSHSIPEKCVGECGGDMRKENKMWQNYHLGNLSERYRGTLCHSFNFSTSSK